MSWRADLRTRARRALLGALLACCAAAAAAGRACEETQAGAAQLAGAFDAALNLAKTLDASGQKLAIIATAGRISTNTAWRFRMPASR